MRNDDKRDFVTTQDWHGQSDEIEFRIECFVNGNYQHSTSDTEVFETINPSRGSVLAQYPVGSEKDIEDAVQAAKSAYQTTWRNLAPQTRKAMLLDWADLLEARVKDLALRDCLEMGKPITFACSDVFSGVQFIRFYAESIDKYCGDVAPTDPANGLTVSIPEPWGVVGAIVPWNFPFLTACMATGPALAAGNTVVLKPSELSPSSALLMAELASQVHIPNGVINVVPGLGSTVGKALAQHRDVKKLHFTGSTAIGRKMLKYSSESNGKSVMLEVGGKNPQIVLEDAKDIPGIGAALATAAFFNTGQVCVARSRLIIHRRNVDDILEQIRVACDEFKIGDPLDSSTTHGPVASQPQLSKIRNHVDMAVKSGAVTSLGGDYSDSGTGYYYPPTVLTEVAESCPLVRDEVFGPVISVHTFDSEQEAIELANDTRFGLAASAWTTRLDSAMRIARNLDAGRVEIRSSTAPSSSLETFSAEPFGESGFGVLGGLRGIEPYLRWKGIEFIAT